MSRSCLLEAIETLRRMPDVDEDLRDQAVHTLEGIMADATRTQEQVTAAMIAAAKDMRRAAFVQHVQRKANEARVEAILTRLTSIEDLGEQARVWRGMLEGAGDYSKTGQADVASLIRSNEARVLGRLEPVWNYIAESRITRGAGTIRASEGAKQFNLALHGATEGVDPRAIELAALWKEVVGEQLATIRASGKWVGQLDDWGYQSHSPSRINSDYDAWRAFMVEHLDPEVHPDPGASADVIFNTVTLRHLDETAPGGFSYARKVKFRTPEAAVEYTMRFGDTDLHFGLFSKARQIARQAVLTKELGPEFDRTIEQVTARMQRQAAIAARDATTRAERTRANRAVKEAKRAETLGPALTGAMASPHDIQLSNVMGMARNWMVTQYLGQIPMAMLGTDSLISVIGGRFHTGGFASSMMAHMRAAKEVLSEGPMRQYLRELGVWNHAMTMSAMDRFATPFAMSEQLRGLAGQTATAAQRLSGAHALERAFRSASMVVVSRSLVRNLRMGWNDLPRKYRTVLEGNGFTAGKWRDLQSAHQVVPDIEVLDWQALPPALREHVTAFMWREADTMTLYPGYYDRALLTFGGRAGTATGELAATATQFWSWPIAMMRKVMAREVRHGGMGALGAAAALTVGGAFTVQMYAAAKNQPMFEWDAPELWVRALARSGLLTPIGELVLNAAKYDRIEAGPVGGTGAQLAKSLFQSGAEYLEGESEKAARRTAQNIESLLVPNIWWLQYGATSRAMDAIMWELDPNYMRARERRWINEGRDL